MEVKKTIGCDVLVVGGGNAGLAATIEAKNRGADVLLIEKAPKESRGGNSRLSGGLFRTAYPGGTKDFEPLLKGTKLPKGELDIEPYSKDDFCTKVINLSEGFSDRTFTEIFVEKSLETVTWMKEQGIQWDLNPVYMVEKEGKLFWPAGVTVLVANGIGEGLVENWYSRVEQLGIDVLYDTAARELIMNVDGKICGVFAKTPEGFIRIDAKNVVLSCGGFQANPEMRRRYLGTNWDLVKLRGTRYDTGDGQRMAMNVGAANIGHWGGVHASIVSEDSPMVEATRAACERYSYQYGIIVNRDGKRFVDEGEDYLVYTYAKYGKEILKQPGSVAYQIFDGKTIPFLRTEYHGAEHVESQSLEELAEDLDIDAEAFLKTVNEFNEAITEEKPFIHYALDGRRTRGLDPDKTNWAQKIDTPPYHGYAVVCGLTMTYGGLKTNERTQVIDTSDHVIDGLYAVGELTGGFFYNNYPSGTGLMRGAVMGRIAGAEAATNI